MRAPTFLVALGIVASSCAAPAPPPAATPAAAPPDPKAIAVVLDDWHDAAARADEARYFSHFAIGGVFLGTDARERWDVAAFRLYAHPRFASGKAWAFRSTSRDIVIAQGGGIAWFDELLSTERLGPARGSGVLVRQDGAWKITQYNLSIPIPNERFDEVQRAIVGGKPTTTR